MFVTLCVSSSTLLFMIYHVGHLYSPRMFCYKFFDCLLNIDFISVMDVNQGEAGEAFLGHCAPVIVVQAPESAETPFTLAARHRQCGPDLEKCVYVWK